MTVNRRAKIGAKGEKMILTPTYHVFDMYKVHQDATYLPIKLECGDYTYDDRSIPAITATASHDAAGKIHISICNLDPNKAATVRCEIRGAGFKKVSGTILTAPKMNTHNTFDNPEVVKPADFDDFERSAKGLNVTLPSKSVVVIEIA